MTSFVRMRVIILSYSYVLFFIGWLFHGGLAANADEGLLPNKFPMQDQALELSERFLLAIDRNDFAEVQSLLGEEILVNNNLSQILSTFSKIKSSLGGAASRRSVIDLETKSSQQGYPNAVYLVVKYRSIYPRGSVSEAVSMSIDRGINEWRVVGWWAGPSKY